ncbi:MAG TPA: XrtA/PEP-CTERM system histidine kinase PrsK [Casimicrobiaceae bacterium]|nr:XrtA/PEP-CTERM system histidine kinase PrsK [Casimicrobiaceae bacterium]
MTSASIAQASTWSYGIALLFYTAFAARIALGWTRSARAVRLAVAVVATIPWAAACILAANIPTARAFFLVNLADALRYGAWFVFLAMLMRGSSPGTRPRARWPALAAAIALVASVALSEGLPLAAALGASPRFEFALRLGLAVFGLALVEQLYRRVHQQARWAIKPLAIALAAIFGYELFFYADAMLFGRIDADIWIARGAAAALVVPFFAVATARNAGWTIEMHLSRGAVFHSTAIVVSGVFLLGLAATGYFVRYIGGAWGRALAIELVFAGALLGLLVATSGRFRSRLKVFVSKHFFSYRYDYREEWLRITRTLANETLSANVGERTILALADLVESPGGALWLKDDEGRHVPAARWNMPAFDAVEAAEGSLSQFLAREGWIVNLDEAVSKPAQYPDLVLPSWLAGRETAWLLVPLLAGTELIGFVVLAPSRAKVDVNWEVRDLLKTASRQAASYLGQIRATEALLEARKFDAFNRMSAFVVHDLKNLVAQLSLMLRNAERHRDNPEFQRDMLTTVEHVVGRMNGLMLQLRTGTTPSEKRRPVDLDGIVRRVCAAKAGTRAPIAMETMPVSAFGHEDRLEHVIGHLVQNALDATAEEGEVGVRIRREGGSAVVEVRDTGPGMTPEFLREHFFKPFETTKPAGMGIGVYESAQYIKSVGGEIRVESTPGKGTAVRVLLPVSDGSGAAVAHGGEAAAGMPR